MARPRGASFEDLVIAGLGQLSHDTIGKGLVSCLSVSWPWPWQECAFGGAEPVSLRERAQAPRVSSAQSWGEVQACTRPVPCDCASAIVCVHALVPCPRSLPPPVQLCALFCLVGEHARRARACAMGGLRAWAAQCAGIRAIQACMRDPRACTCVNAGAGVVHCDALRLDVCRALVSRVSGNVASKRSRIRARHGISPSAPRVGNAGWAAAAS